MKFLDLIENHGVQDLTLKKVHMDPALLDEGSHWERRLRVQIQSLISFLLTIANIFAISFWSFAPSFVVIAKKVACLLLLRASADFAWIPIDWVRDPLCIYGPEGLSFLHFPRIFL